MSLEGEQVHGEGHEFSFEDVEEKMKLPCGDVDDLISYQSLEHTGNNWTRQINLRIIRIQIYLNPYVQMRSPWERALSEKKTGWQELMNVLEVSYRKNCNNKDENKENE